MCAAQQRSDSMNKYIKHVVKDAISASPDKALTSEDIVDCAQRKFNTDIGTMVRALLVMGQQMGNVRSDGIDRYFLNRGRELDAMVKNLCCRKQKRRGGKRNRHGKKKCRSKRKCPIRRCCMPRSLYCYLHQVKRRKAPRNRNEPSKPNPQEQQEQQEQPQN